MRNLMTLRGVHTWLFAAVLAAACGGSDPPGGGNNETTDGGDTTDGTTGNGGTDGHVPNPNKPLVEAIQGLWELVELYGQNACCSTGCDCTNIDCAAATPETDRDCAHMEDNMICAVLGCMVVDPSNPSCQYLGGDLGPPGDACVWGFYNALAFILDGSTLRRDPPPGCPSPELPSPLFCTRLRGEVLDNGTRMEYMEEWIPPEGGSPMYPRTAVFRKVR